MHVGKVIVRRGGCGVAVDVVESVVGQAVPDPDLKPVQPICVLVWTIPDLSTANSAGSDHIDSDPRIIICVCATSVEDLRGGDIFL